MQGPFTYAVGRAKERQALLTEQPAYGDTPARASLARRRAAVSERYLAKLLSQGVALDSAIDEAVALAEKQVAS